MVRLPSWPRSSACLKTGAFLLLVSFGTAAALTSTRSRASAPSLPPFSAPAGWAEGESYSGMRTWTGDRQKKEVISILEDDSMKGETPLADDRKFLDAVEYGISVPNWLAGVKNWKVEKLERHPLPNGHRIVLVGSYFNARNELIRFEEWKFFLKNGYGQINFSEASPAPLSRDRVREILQRYRPFGT